MKKPPSIPLGEQESDVLEFKSKDSLRNAADIASEVVAFLNAGKKAALWIGVLEEKDGRTVVEPIDEPEKGRDRLWNHLLDTIEPQPTPDEVRIEVVRHPSIGPANGPVLLISIHPGRRGPFAQLIRSTSARRYAIRAGRRQRSMSREELAQAFQKSLAREDQGVESAKETMLARREKDLRFPEATYRLAAAPVPPMSIDIQSQILTDLLRDPRRSGTSPTMITFADPKGEPILRGQALVMESVRLPPRVWTERSVRGRISPAQQAGRQPLPRVESDFTVTEIWQDGSLIHRTPLFCLEQGSGPVPASGHKMIDPLALIYRTVSLLRLLSVLAREVLKCERFLIDVALTRLHGWMLAGGTPGRPDYLEWVSRSRWPATPNEFSREQPFEFRYEEIAEEADSCAWRIVRELYAGFGLREDQIAKFFDVDSRRFTAGV